MSAALIANSGTIKIQNGILTSNANSSLINVYSGAKVIVTGGELIATGTRQVIYNNAGGIVEIYGGYLSSKASGKPDLSNMERAAIQNLANATLTILGGTIIGVNQQAISNEGTMTIGQKDGNIVTSSPIIQGKTYGIKSSSTFNFYDGIIRGKTQNAIEGNITEMEDNSSLVTGTETIDNEDYNTAYLNRD